MLVPVDKLIDNPNQTRKAYDPIKIDVMADSIKKRGLLQPIKVTNNNGHYVIAFGHCRVRAYKKLGLPEIEAIVERDMSDLDLAVEGFIENYARKDLDIMETAEGFGYIQKQLEDLKFAEGKDTTVKQKEIAAAAGCSESTVFQYLDILKYSETFKENIMSTYGVHKHNISIEHYRSVPKSLPQPEREEILEKAAKEKLKPDDVKLLGKAFQVADKFEKETILERPYEELEQESISIKTLAQQKREEANQKEQRRQTEDREVKKYFNNCDAFHAIIQDAIDAAIYGKFAPETIHMVINRHTRIKASLDELERKIKK